MERSAKLPGFVQVLLSACPSAGEGVHNWLFRVARVLHPYLSDKSDIHAIIAAASHGCGRHISAREIDDAIENSAVCAWKPGTSQKVGEIQKLRRPSRDYKKIAAFVAEGLGLYDLWERSPHRFEENRAHTEEIIDALFQNNPLLCCGVENWDFATKSRSKWRGELSQQQFIVPSPMSCTTGTTQDGRKSAHTLDNTGPRRFLVIEFDFKVDRENTTETAETELLRKFAETGISTHDVCAALLMELARFAPLALVVHSGGKSLHGWFYCQGQPEPSLARFMRYAVSLGADPQTWGRSQFVRMPDGIRNNRQRQVAYFLNPEVVR